MSLGKRGLCFFAAFSTGAFVAVYLLPAWLWPWLGAAALIPAGFFLARRRPAAVLVCLGLCASLLWCGAFRAVFFAPAQALNGRRVQVTAVLAETPTASDFGAYVPCWLLGEGGVPVKGMLYGGEELRALDPGDRVTAVVHCTQTALLEGTRFTPSATRGVFLWMKIQGTGTIQQATAVPWWCLPRWVGQRLSERISAAFPRDVSGLLAAMVTGDKLGLDSALHSDMARTGTAHLAAVSGMHVCFLVALLTLFTGYEPRRRLAVCLPVLLFFALAVGGTPSVLRACVMQGAFLLGEVLGREEDRWAVLFGTLALMLVLDPFAAADTGLQLSFAAVAGIGLVAPRVRVALARVRVPGNGRLARLFQGIWTQAGQILAASLGAMVFTVPLTAYYFGSVSILAPLANLLILPVASVLFAGGLLTGLLGLTLPGAAAVAGFVLAWPARYVLWVIRRLSSLIFCAVTLSEPYYLVAFLGVYALVLVALLWRSERRRAWLLVLCGGAMIAGSFLFTRLSFHTGELTAAVLDVGQGQSIVAMSRGKVAVVDCGGTGDKDPGDVCADYLADRGGKTIDLLILTHCHADHVNGLARLFQRTRVREVILPRPEGEDSELLWLLELIRDEGAQLTWLEEDTVRTLGEAGLRLYAPLGEGEANEAGLAVAVQAEDFGLLITGDMSAEMEQRLIKRRHLPHCQVLVAGHHGSAGATGGTLLWTVRPEVAVISVGAGNPYGHPADQTLARLRDRGMEVYRTDRSGTVTIHVT